MEGFRGKMVESFGGFRSAISRDKTCLVGS